MKIQLLALSFLLSLACTAQDTLFFINGTTMVGKLIRIDNNSNLIRWAQDKDVFLIDKKTVKEIKGTTLSDEEQMKTVMTGIGYAPQTFVSINETKISYKLREPKYAYHPFSIGTDLLSLVGHRTIFRFINNSSNSKGRFLTLEPEYGLNKWFAIKMNLAIGIKNENFKAETKNSVLTLNTGGYYNRGYDEDGYLGVNSYDYATSSNNSMTNYYYGSYSISTPVFEIGLQPKFYFGRESKLPFFISPFLNYGQVKGYDRNYYVSLITAQYLDANNQPYNYLVVSRITSESTLDRFSYMNLGLSSGLIFNVSKYISFSTELMVPIKFFYKDSPTSTIYEEIDGEPFIQKTVFQAKSVSIPFFKFNLILRLPESSK